eukprot:GDKH01009022.1.p3 GENE.GDKH01009022.1~~GDKH01009022.1.p3  ORF type:complete len:61 (-),score=6.23 GDKH01009022.1:173-355(-)
MTHIVPARHDKARQKGDRFPSGLTITHRPRHSIATPAHAAGNACKSMRDGPPRETRRSRH